MDVVLSELWKEKKKRNAHFSAKPPKRDEVELYDLNKDFNETQNLYKQNKSLVKVFLKNVTVYFQSGKTGQAGTSKLQLDERIREQLRALGYLN